MKNSTIQQAILEMADAVKGSRIQRIRLLDFRTVIFDLYGRGNRFSLAVTLKKQNSGFHLLFEKIHNAYLYESPASTKLHALLRGFRIEQLKFIEQCVAVRMRSSSIRYLVFDFNASNVLVISEEGEIVFRFFKKGMITGAPNILSIEERIPGNGEKDSWLDKIVPEKQPDSRIKEAKDSSQSGELPLNRKLSTQFFKRRSEVLVRGALKIMKSEQKKVSRLLEKLQLEAKELENSEAIRSYGELLKYNLSKIQRGVSSVKLKDFKGNDVEIRLDPARNPAENMHLYFERYKKLGRKKEIFEKKYAYETKRLIALERLLQKVTDKKAISLKTPPSEVLDLLQGEYFKESFQRRVKNAIVQRPVIRQLKKDGKKDEFLHFTSRTGKVILTGRNSRENDELVIRKARGNDLWFHIEDGTGSAVVLRYDRKGEFQETDIADAAALALYFSKLRGQKAGNVVYTHCKYVKKPKGTKQGYVIYHHNKTRYTVLDEKILTRLIDSKIPIMTSGSKRAER